MTPSLFSIEIYLDRLRLHDKIDCAFPSTVFKLLDFEPVQLSSFSREVFQRLQPLLEARNFRGQLEELKDHEGNYVVRRGKSVLFPLEPKRLVHYLNTVPLYVLVADSVVDPSRLVGVASIPIGDIARKVYEDILQNGVGIPSCHDRAGVFRLVSLMGHIIGMVSLKVRVMSVGPSIIPHMPKGSLVQVESGSGDKKRQMKREEGVERDAEFDAMLKSAKPGEEIGVKDLPAGTKQGDQQRIVHVHAPIGFEEEVELEEEQSPRPDFRDLAPDPLDPNIVEPPPLYYNVYAKNYDETVTGERHSRVRSRAVGAVTVAKSPTRSPKRQDESKIDKEDVKFHEMMRRVDDRRKAPINDNRQHLPLLNALLDELTVWKSHEDLSYNQGESDESVSAQEEHSKPVIADRRRPKKPKLIVRSTAKSRSAAVPRPSLGIRGRSISPSTSQPLDEARNAYLQRLASPRVRHPGPKGSVPRTKSWIRSEPEYRGPFTSRLTYRLTETHKMRLQMRNPVALGAIRAEEDELESARKRQLLQRTYTLQENGNAIHRPRSSSAGTRRPSPPKMLRAAPPTVTIASDAYDRAHHRRHGGTTATTREPQQQHRGRRPLARTPRRVTAAAVSGADDKSQETSTQNGGAPFTSTEEPELYRIKEDGGSHDEVDGGFPPGLDSTGSGLDTGDDFIPFNPQQSSRSPQLSTRSAAAPVVVPPLAMTFNSSGDEEGGASSGRGGGGGRGGPAVKPRRSHSSSEPSGEGVSGSNDTPETSEWRTSASFSPPPRTPHRHKNGSPLRASTPDQSGGSLDSSPEHQRYDSSPRGQPGDARNGGSRPPRTPPRSPVVRRVPFGGASQISKGGRTPLASLDNTATSGLGGGTGPGGASFDESSPTKATSFTRVTRFDRSVFNTAGGGGTQMQTEDSLSSSFVPTEFPDNMTFDGADIEYYDDDFEK